MGIVDRSGGARRARDGGYLTHPHTSAGRVPTEIGYRHYVDSADCRGLAAGGFRRPTAAVAAATGDRRGAAGVHRGAGQRHRPDGARHRPSPSLAAAIHRVEVLRLQPTRVVAIAISSTGAIAKRVFDFDLPVDPGLVEWASSYLNELLTGMGVGSRMIADRLAREELGPAEADFIATLGAPSPTCESEPRAPFTSTGTSRLLSAAHLDELPRADELMTALERRANMLGMLRSALDERSVFLWIGDENPQPELRSVSVVGANYGLAHRNLGRSVWSGRCGWTTRPRSPRCGAPRASSRATARRSSRARRPGCRATTTRCWGSAATPTGRR